ncbi:DUF397 domain-containing protein [Streptomyces sp. ISL-12]|uniref:DUF397 domain-containing protein n=1 Tax=Streptomyces sp. ISL-12 TaxID=2819177 RepID=UPI001BEBD2A2|nr:DUF397 domain-containing protein [Streptomyces sp. ISL-12]MBT2411980.1 DUF397 domain-containing protein [Streptomyces sp. ISL-12]
MADHLIPNASALRGWRRSSYSNGEGGSCLEIVDGWAYGVPVRDSKVADGPALVFRPSEWTAFVGAVRDGGLPAQQ